MSNVTPLLPPPPVSNNLPSTPSQKCVQMLKRQTLKYKMFKPSPPPQIIWTLKQQTLKCKMWVDLLL